MLADERKAQNMKNEYIQHHAIPWFVGHLSMRATGFQIFTAIQGGLLVAWATRGHWALPLLGLASCYSFLLWDTQNLNAFRRIHEICEELVERTIFGVGNDGRARKGLHRYSLDTLPPSGSNIPLFDLKRGLKRKFVSHTCAIRVMIIFAAVLWMAVITYKIL